MQSKLKVVFRADSSKEIGMGHVARCITLAKALIEVIGAEVLFLTRENESSIITIKNAGFNVISFDKNIDADEEKDFVLEVVEKISPEIFVFDILDGYKDLEFQKELKKHAKFLGVIFDNSDYAELPQADFVINGNPMQLEHKYRQAAKYLLGPKYFIMSDEYAELHKKNYPLKEKPRRLLITLGGSDHSNLIFKVLKAIKSKLEGLNVKIALGSAFGSTKELEKFVKDGKFEVEIVMGSFGLGSMLAETDIAVTAAGNTLFERLAVGVPGMTLSQIVLHNGSRMQDDIAKAFDKLGANLHIGVGTEVSEEKITAGFVKLLNDFSMRKSMSMKGKELVDGLGAKRIATFVSAMVRR